MFSGSLHGGGIDDNLAHHSGIDSSRDLAETAKGSSGSTSTSPIISGDKAPMYDFSDSFYLRNGIDPTKIAGRPTGTGASAVAKAPDADHRGIRITALNGMHDDGGKANFFGVLGTIQATAFTNTTAGRAAQQIADKYIAYIFPKAGSNTLSPASKREDELIPLNNGYFSNDPLNVWREAFVNYTASSTWSSKAKQLASKLIEKNGTDTDGTPFLKTINDITDAQKEGLVTVTKRADDGSQGAPWFFCAVFKDFSKNAITKDSTLTVAHNNDGTVASGERDLQTLFDQLQAAANPTA